MKITDILPAAIGLATGGLLWAEPAPLTPPPATDPMMEALPILQARYVDFAGLHFQSGDQLGDLVARSGGKISVLTAQMDAPAPMREAALPDDVEYLRLASFAPPKNWADFAGDLKVGAGDPHPLGAVLDLRGNGSNDYAGAARLLSLFVPADRRLENHPSAPAAVPPPQATTSAVAAHRFPAPIIVLTDGQTAGAAEALAGMLKSDGALVVGQATAGVGFEEDKLADGSTLRFAVPLPTALPDSPPRPVIPDIAVAIDPRNEKAALTLIGDDHVLDVIQESAQRQRMSEASLVSGQDPEWDAYLASLQKGPVLLSLPRIHDPVLVTGLDSLRAIRWSERTAPVQAAANTTTAAGASVQ